MTPSAWQMLCGLEAWRVIQVPRPPRRHSPGPAADGGLDGDDGDLLAGQRAAALAAAYHGGSGPVGFAWIRDRAGGPVQVVAAGRALAATPANQDPAATPAHQDQAATPAPQDVPLKLPAGGRGQALGPGGLARMLVALPGWVRIAGVADSLLATPDPPPARPDRTARPSLEDGLLAAWPGPFAWLVLAEPVQAGQLDALAEEVSLAQSGAQRLDSPAAQLAVQRLSARHAELRQAAATGLWTVRLLAGGRTSVATSRDEA